MRNRDQTEIVNDMLRAKWQTFSCGRQHTKDWEISDEKVVGEEEEMGVLREKPQH